MSLPVKLAYHIPTRKIIHIDIAERGLKCECKCIRCHEKFEAVKGDVRTKHFRHYKNIYCTGSPETALHKLVKQIITDNSQINLPGYGIIYYTNPVQEKSFFNILPDVTAITGNQNVFFEITVTNPVNKIKESFYKAGYHKSIEIDLRNLSVDSYEDIKDAVLNQINNKRVIFWEKEKEFDILKEIGIFFLKYWFIIIPVIFFLFRGKSQRR